MKEEMLRMERLGKGCLSHQLLSPCWAWFLYSKNPPLHHCSQTLLHVCIETKNNWLNESKNPKVSFKSYMHEHMYSYCWQINIPSFTSAYLISILTAGKGRGKENHLVWREKKQELKLVFPLCYSELILWPWTWCLTSTLPLKYQYLLPTANHWS